MLSIGNLAKLASVSARTLRYYESIGLITSASRGENNYRYYDQTLVQKINRIKELQELGFHLDEVKAILQVTPEVFIENLQGKLIEVGNDIQSMQTRREKIRSLLSVSKKIETGESITDIERGQYMEGIKEEIVRGLKSKYGHVSAAQLERVEKESALYQTSEKQDFLIAFHKCMQFAKERKLKLGPGRGSSSASIVLLGLGLTALDPAQYNLLHERLLNFPIDVHIDVEFERGQEFVDYCREISRKLSFGKINAFKMPLLDIINNVHAILGKEIDYNSIDDNDDIVLNPFRSGDLEKIFGIHISEDALIMRLEESHLPEYKTSAKLIEYVSSQKIHNFRDVINISALWRPWCQEMIERIESYRDAKINKFTYSFLSQDLQNYLRPNFGRILYHEDLIRIISSYTGWNFERCNDLRRGFLRSSKSLPIDAELFKSSVPVEMANLVIEESKYAFCQPHAIAFAQLTKQTAVLKSLHCDIYYQEIDKWEQKHGYRWDDIGVKVKGISILQD